MMPTLVEEGGSEELFERTAAAKQALGDRVMVLGHNYQRDAVIVWNLFLARLALPISRRRPYSTHS